MQALAVDGRQAPAGGHTLGAAVVSALRGSPVVDGERHAGQQEAAAAAGPPAQQHQDQQQQERSPAGPPHRIPSASRASYPQPGPCAFLRPGQAFEGRQRVSHNAASHHGGSNNPKAEHWEVHACIQVGG